MKLARAAGWVVMSLLAIAGCDDDGDSRAFGRYPDACGGGAPPCACDPVRQDCPAGQQCVGGCNVVGVMAKVFTCALPAPGANATHGQECGVGCAPGHDCFAVPGADGGTRAVCRKYCNSDGDCPNGVCAAEGLVCTPGDTMPAGRVCAH